MWAQERFSVSINPFTISGLPGLHSFAFASSDTKWLIIGGRVNGLHGFLPPFAFPGSGVNQNVYVVDVATQQVWYSSVITLPMAINEQMSSTNMEYYQSDSTLYFVGGYGFSSATSSFITMPYLTAIDVNGLMQAVINQTSILPYFRQIVDTNMAVTGGDLGKINNEYNLVFGQRFDGRYNKSDSSSLFVQHYTNEIRKFTIIDNGTALSIANYQATNDTLNFHRRDYNLVAQIFPDHSVGYTAYSGVFQYHQNIPWFTPVDIAANATRIDTSFTQHLSQYHSAVMPIYDSAFNAMHSVFFGGISMFKLDTVNNTYTTDSLVPFVKTISMVSRGADSILTETKFFTEMPSLQGTNALFVPLASVDKYSNGIIKINSLPAGSNLAGYIIGGIESPLENISDIDPSLTSAVASVYEVYINKQSAIGLVEKENNEVGINSMPNPFSLATIIEIATVKTGNLKVTIINQYGGEIATIVNEVVSVGIHSLQWNPNHLPAGVYNAHIIFNGVTINKKLVYIPQ